MRHRGVLVMAQPASGSGMSNNVDEDPTVADLSPIEATQPVESNRAPSPVAAPAVLDPNATATSRRALVGLAAGAIALGAIIGAVVALTGNDDTTTPPRPV